MKCLKWGNELARQFLILKQYIMKPAKTLENNTYSIQQNTQYTHSCIQNTFIIN